MKTTNRTVTAASVIALLLVLLLSPTEAQLVESERLEEYRKRNYTWPVESFVPNTAGWNALNRERLAQVAQIENSGQRYEGYIQVLRSSLLAPNFTEYGFGLARCPDELLQALQAGIREGLPTARLEKKIEVIDAPKQPLFIERPDLTRRVLQELRHYAETWAKVPLTAHIAYGFRLYQNQSRLTMHVDKMQTHIISFILHIDSSDDAEPWPIFIEDFYGRSHQVLLKPGDMLFYESSKCLHGRPKRLNGSWYSSLFVHYYPRDGWSSTNHQLEAHYIVPPEWSAPPKSHHTVVPLQMVGTSLTEPSCANEWCRSESSIQWSGPGEEGYWIDPDGKKHDFHPRVDSFSDEL